MKKFPILYKYTTIGQPQQWQITVENDGFYTEEGMVGGVITKSLPTVCKGKNPGKKNETTAETQAEKEAAAKWKKKKEEGYNEDIDKSGKEYFQPMLAHEFKTGSIDFKKQRVFVQPKLDGLRADNQGMAITSRNGKPYLSVPHLYQNEVRLDGELYNHIYKEDFNKIVSLCKKQDPTPEELEESAEKVQMWVYDMPDVPGDFSYRYSALKRWYNELPLEMKSRFVLVQTVEVFSEEEIKEWHSTFLAEGYEGTIVRLDGPYENKRSKNLLKYKDFIDEEFEILGYEEGEGGRTGTIGKFIMKHDKIPGKTFKSNVKGNFDYLRKIWQNVDSYVGKTATIKYFQRTPDDVPRFPFIIKIAREDYE